jgi:hypothetical protein
LQNKKEVAHNPSHREERMGIGWGAKLRSSLIISNFARQKTAEKPYLRENEEFRVFVLRGFENREKGLEIGRCEEERKKTQPKTTKEGKKNHLLTASSFLESRI